MNELSLFSGACGGVLGTKYFLGWKTIGYVEINDFCQRLIAQRIKDGLLDNAPIFTDIRAFVDSGCAELYRGVVDVVSAGVPCQPASLCGKRMGGNDDRWLWPETIRALDIVRPRRGLLLENPPGILSVRDSSGRPLLGRILRELAKVGLHPQWDGIPSSALGGYDERDRIWFVADDQGVNGFEHDLLETRGKWRASLQSRRLHSMALAERGQQANQRLRCEPRLDRLVRRTSGAVDRLKASGNIQRPIVAATAWKLLTGNITPHPTPGGRG